MLRSAPCLVLVTVFLLTGRIVAEQVVALPDPAPRAPARDVSQPKIGTAVIRGRVVAADTGAPIRRVRVQAVGGGLRDGRAMNTDAEGRYELRDLPAGRYTVSAIKSSYIRLEFGQRRPFGRSQPVEIADGQVLERVDFSLPRGSVITGHVVDEFGEAVVGAQVEALRFRFAEGRRLLVPAGRGSQTNDIGQFRLFGLEPGDYYLSAILRTTGEFGGSGAMSDDRAGYAPTYYPGTPSVAEAQRLSLDIGQELPNVDVVLIPTRLARISGTVTDSSGRSLPEAFVQLLTVSRERGVYGSASSFSRVLPDGTFSILNVTPGDYTLLVQNDRPGILDPEFASQAITVAGADISGIGLITSRGASMTGQILTETGAPPARPSNGLRVAAVAVDSSPVSRERTAVVAGDWTFELRGLAGKYVFRMTGAVSDWRTKAVFLNGVEITDTPIEIDDASAGAASLQIVLTTQMTALSGAVTDARGQAQKDYTAVVFAEDADQWGPRSRHVTAARPDQEGRFTVRGLPSGRYLAVAVDEIEQDEWTNPDVLERLRTGATPVTLNEGEAKTIELKLITVP